MTQYILKDRKHIDAAVVDIDNNALANQSRDQFALKHGAKGHKTVMAAQDSQSLGNEVEIMAVTLLKFGTKAPNGFVTMGQDKDGSVLALPDFRTPRGEMIAKEMAELPPFSRQLTQALGMSVKIENGKVTYGISSVEEVGRQIVVKTSPNAPAIGLEPLMPVDYADLKQGAERAQKMASVQLQKAPNPHLR